MIHEFYGLELDPFSLSPDLEFLFLSEAHEEAVAHLLFGLEQNEGFILIVGDIGTGKTLALHRLITQVSKAFIPISINVTTIDFEQILRLVLLKLDIDPQADAPLASLIDDFEKILIKTRNQGKKVLLIVDEAQNLSVEVLEAIRLLMNLAQPGSQVLQLVLAGQLGLRTKMDLPEMRQLRQRIRVDYQFGFLNRQEVEDYVLHRLKTSGRTDPLFDKRALDRIFSFSHGVPRIVNILANKALLAGYVEESKMISGRHLDDIELDGLFDMPQPVTSDKPQPVTSDKPQPVTSDKPQPDTSSSEVPTSKPAETGPEPEEIPIPVQKPPRPDSSGSYRTKTASPRGGGRWFIGAFVLLGIIAAVASFPMWGPSLGFDSHDEAGSRVKGDAVPTHPVSRPDPVQSTLDANAPEKSLGLADSVVVGEEVESIPEDSVSISPVEEIGEEITSSGGEIVVATSEAPPGQDQNLAAAASEPPLGEEQNLAATDEKFLVHVASFLAIERSINFSNQLKRLGVESTVHPVTARGGKVWHRVYIGPFPTQEGAMEVAEIYKDKGWIQFSRITAPDPNWDAN